METKSKSAAEQFFDATVQSIVDDISSLLAEMSPEGIFEGYDVDNLWEEYCLAVQGHFLSNSNEVSFFGRQEAQRVFRDLIPELVVNLVNKLPDHQKKFVEGWIEEHWEHYSTDDRCTVDTVLINEIKSDLEDYADNYDVDGTIPVFRGYVDAAIEGSGVVWNALAERDALKPVLEEFSEDLHRDGKLDDVAHALLEAFLHEVNTEANEVLLLALIENHGVNFRDFLLNDDIIPALENIVEEL